MDEIATEAGVGKATLYRYFESKEELLRACLEEIVASLGARMEAPRKPRLQSTCACAMWWGPWSALSPSTCCPSSS